ncbi:MAG: MarR family transcriptional regulator [Frondihabitans sp.]|nr:MarR family transcriptional regulator [Frondihabitans sp.]
MATDLGELGREVKQAQWRHHRAIERLLAVQGTTLAQWDALRAISRAPGSSAHDLAERTFQSDQAFGTLASRLVAQGLVERRPGEGRRVEHHLTEAGRATLESAQPVVDDLFEGFFGDLSEEERVTLLALLKRV